MKPFTINRNSWHYKLNQNVMNEWGRDAGLMERYWEPRHNDFCSYWRSTIFRLIFIVFLVALGIFVLAVIGFTVYNNPLGTLEVIGNILFGIVAFIAIMGVFALFSVTKNKASESLFVQKYRAHKSKICPMVEYKQ